MAACLFSTLTSPSHSPSIFQILIFSSWSDVLDILVHALSANKVPFAYAKGGGRPFQKALAAFKSSASASSSHHPTEPSVGLMAGMLTADTHDLEAEQQPCEPEQLRRKPSKGKLRGRHRAGAGNVMKRSRKLQQQLQSGPRVLLLLVKQGGAGG